MTVAELIVALQRYADEHPDRVATADVIAKTPGGDPLTIADVETHHGIVLITRE